MQLKQYKLGEILDVTRGASLSGEYYATEGEYIRLTCGNFDYQNNCFKENTSKNNLYYIGCFKPEFLMEEGDIITPLTEQAIGLLGSTAIIPESNKYIQSQDVAKIVCKEELLDKNFAFYLISSNMVKKQLNAAAQQTKIRHTSPDKIKDCTVWIPDLSMQKRIGILLRTIDQKISLNRAINQNLEALAKQLYDYWFVQFDFPDENGRPYKSSGGKMVWNEQLKYKVPQKWELQSYGDLCYMNKASLSKKDCIDYIEYLDTSSLIKGTISNTQKLNKDKAPSRAQRKVEDLTILYSCVRPRLQHYGIICNPINNMIVSTGFATIDAMNKAYSLMLYMHLTSYNITDFLASIADTAVSAYPSINPSDIASLNILVPPQYIANMFQHKVEPIFRLKEKIRIENINLIKQRDELLPLLMNGQVSVTSNLCVDNESYENNQNSINL